eukprot:6204617-Pleurochrysis_carterae.AAC.1
MHACVSWRERAFFWRALKASRSGPSVRLRTRIVPWQPARGASDARGCATASHDGQTHAERRQRDSRQGQLRELPVAALYQ